MAENPDYKELLQVLNEFEVDYLSGDDLCRLSRGSKSRQRESGDTAVFDDSILRVTPQRSETDFPGERQRESLMNEIRSKKKRFKLDRTSYEQVRRQVLRRDGWRCRAR